MKKCPICAARRRRRATHCPDCGTSYAMIDRYYTYPDPHTPRSSVLPLGIAVAAGCLLIACCVVTFSVFLFSTLHGADTDPQQTPSGFLSPGGAAGSVEGCFSIRDGAAVFLPERWDGHPVLTIPDTVDGTSVTMLAPGCFQDCTELTTIILPDTLTEIGEEAFAGCKNLRGLYLPDGMESIGENAFSGCVSMEAICIPLSVKSIAPGCFDDCASLLYINYGGTFRQWAALYEDFITPFSIVICTDGSYYHGVKG